MSIFMFICINPENAYSNLNVTSPNGGEKIIIGDDEFITWQGVPEKKPVKLEYSSDGGINWDVLTNYATGNSWNWTDIDVDSTNLGLIRVSVDKKPDIDRQYHFGGSLLDDLCVFFKASDGHYVLAGTSSSYDKDIKDRPEGYIDNDFSIMKIDTGGEIIWQRTYGDRESQTLSEVIETNDGGFLIAGFDSEIVEKDGEMYRHFDVILYKIDSSGETEWEKSFGGTGNEQAVSLWEGENDFFVLCNTESKDGDISSPKDEENIDIWLLRISKEGDLLSEKCYGGEGNDDGRVLTGLKNGNLLIAGSTESYEGDLIGRINNNTSRDAWVFEVSIEGDIISSKTIERSGYDVIFEGTASEDKGFVFAGTTNSDEIEGFHGDSESSYDIWVLKLDSEYNTEWEKCFGGTGLEQPFGINNALDGCFLVSGTTNSTDGDILGGYVKKEDFILLKIDGKGNLQWSSCSGGKKSDVLFGADQSPDGCFYLGGFTDSRSGATGEDKGVRDFWFAKLNKEYAIDDDVSDETFRIIEEDIELLSPNGGEVFLIGGSEIISWNGTKKNTTVNLSLSYDKGDNWEMIANNFSGGEYILTNIQGPQSDECLVKVETNNAPEIEKNICFGGNEDDLPSSIYKSRNGGYFMLGTSSSCNGERDGGLIYGEHDIWLVEFDPDFNIVRHFGYGGEGDEIDPFAAELDEGGYVIASTTTSKTDYGQVSGNHGGKDIWVLKTDKDGEIITQKCYGGSADDILSKLIPTSDNGFLLVGYTESNDGDVSNFSGDSIIHYMYDGWAIKLNSHLEIEWETASGDPHVDRYEDAVETESETYRIVGTGYSNSQFDAVITEYSTTGKNMFVKKIGVEGHDVFYSIAKAGNGEYYCAGIFSSVNDDIDGYRGGIDGWLVKIDSEGNMLWQKKIGGTNNDWFTKVTADADGQLFVIGWSKSNDYDVDNNKGFEDAFVLCADSDGNKKWTHSLGGSHWDIGNDIIRNPDGTTVLLMETLSNDGDVTDFEFYKEEESEIWICKLSDAAVGQSDMSDGVFSIIDHTSVVDKNKTYVFSPNPADNQIRININGPDRVRLFDVNGKLVLSSKHNIVDVSGISPGVYLLVLEKNGCVQREKLIIER